MKYRVAYKPGFARSFFQAEDSLFQYSKRASDAFLEDFRAKLALLADHPRMYQRFADDPYFRSAPLAHDYRLFYHLDEGEGVVWLARVLHGKMDLARRLRDEAGE